MVMREVWRILDPVAEVDVGPSRNVTPRLTTVRGKRIGLLDNGWRSLDTLLPAFRDLVQQQEGAGEAVFREKLRDGIGASPEMLDDLARESDFVVVGLGN